LQEGRQREDFYLTHFDSVKNGVVSIRGQSVLGDSVFQRDVGHGVDCGGASICDHGRQKREGSEEEGGDLERKGEGREDGREREERREGKEREEWRREKLERERKEREEGGGRKL
jgi:hypothetical protein